MHHAGLLPKYRLLVERLAQTGPAQGHQRHGHAGRGGEHPHPHGALHAALQVRRREAGHAERARLPADRRPRGPQGLRHAGQRGGAGPRARHREREDRPEGGEGREAMPRKPPPQKGFVSYDKNTFERLQTGLPEPLESRFEVTHGLLLNLLQSEMVGGAEGYQRLVRLIFRSHGSDYIKRRNLKEAAACFRTLRNAGLVLVHKGEGGSGATVSVAPGLQRDFSLNQTLSLYLLDTLNKLDHEAETYALDVVTLVESILREPRGGALRPAARAQGREDRRAEGPGHGVRRADGGAGQARVAQAQPGLHLHHLQRLRGEAPLGGRGEHPAQVHRPRHVRAVPVLPRLRARVRPAAQRGRAAALPRRRLQGAHPDGARALPQPGGQRDHRMDARDDPLRRPEPAGGVGADEEPGRGGRPPGRGAGPAAAGPHGRSAGLHGARAQRAAPAAAGARVQALRRMRWRCCGWTREGRSGRWRSWRRR